MSSRFGKVLPAIVALGLAGCVTSEEQSAQQKAAASAWNDCVFDAIPRMDDGKTDALTVAVGISPLCSAQYNTLTQFMVGTMSTENSQAYMRGEMRNNELKLLTSAVLFYRANKRKT